MLNILAGLNSHANCSPLVTLRETPIVDIAGGNYHDVMATTCATREVWNIDFVWGVILVIMIHHDTASISRYSTWCDISSLYYVHISCHHYWCVWVSACDVPGNAGLCKGTWECKWHWGQVPWRTGTSCLRRHSSCLDTVHNMVRLEWSYRVVISNALGWQSAW